MTWQGETFKGKLGFTMAEVAGVLAYAAPPNGRLAQCDHDRAG